MEKFKVVMLLFPELTIQDFVGPYDVFVKTPKFEVLTVALSKSEMTAEGGLIVKATYDFDDCPPADILFVPGGSGVTAILNNKLYQAFLKRQGENAQYISSVCTGALLLAAAGLLKGYKATTHWRSLDLLEMFGIETIAQRVVIDRNRITGGGVTAGIDFGLTLTALIAGADQAKLVQLLLEYNPEPPYNSGAPARASKNTIWQATALSQAQFDLRHQIIKELLTQVSLAG
jgi:cyclohexyl-isocyanide hydratase